MILIIVDYSYNVEALQAAVDHSNEDHQCEMMEEHQSELIFFLLIIQFYYNM